VLDELESARAGSELTPYAYESLEERMITRILEREDEGYIRWTPAGIYEQLAAAKPDLYPERPPRGMLDRFMTQAFTDQLAARRSHRRASQLPAAMLQDTIGRRLVDLYVPVLYKNPEHVSVAEARKILKDALHYVSEVDSYIRPPEDGGKKDENGETEGLSFADAMNLIKLAAPEEKQAIAKYLVSQIMVAAESEEIEIAELVEDGTD
jgi:hypothetical protein